MTDRSGRTARMAVLLVLTLGCGSTDLLGPDAAQGIEGLALIGPQCPVVRVDDPCPDLPHEASIEIRDGKGDTVTRVRSGEDGRFVVGLRAGLYLLVPESGHPFPSASEQEVEVVVGVFTQVTVSFDTGIR